MKNYECNTSTNTLHLNCNVHVQSGPDLSKQQQLDQSLAGTITHKALEPFVLLNLEPSNGQANVFTSMLGVQQAMLSGTDYRSMTCCTPMSS